MDPIYEKLPRAEPDGLVAPEVGEWSRQKNLRLWNYLGIFTTGMKKVQDYRVYVDLFAGAGKNRVRGTDEWLLGSPVLALSVRDPFDRLIFCEKDPGKAAALETRANQMRPDGVHVLNLDANTDDISRVAELIPGGKTLTFCFVDPYDIDFNFAQLERLTRNRRMDVLILLAVQMDARRNLATYVKDGNEKIGRLLGRSDWRDDWKAAESDGIPFARWLTSAFTSSMLRIGYVRPKDGDMQTVTLRDASNVGLYYLAFYSKHPLGYKFWREAVKGATAQTSLGLDL